MNTQTQLEELYEDFEGSKWVPANNWIWQECSGKSKLEVAIGGSIGMAIAGGRALKNPDDIDLVVKNIETANEIVTKAFTIMSKYSTFGKVYYNSKTDFVPDVATQHIRIFSNFWKPICIFVVPTLRYYYSETGLRVQFYNDIKGEARKLEEKDGKKRVDFKIDDLIVDSSPINPDDEPIDKLFEHAKTSALDANNGYKYQ